MKYLIWSVEHSSWWGPAEWGYTQSVKDAGRYSKVAADAICANANLYVPAGSIHEVAIPEIALTHDFYEGMREGVRRWAHWHDGEQFVGSCGTPLQKALAEIDAEAGA